MAEAQEQKPYQMTKEDGTTSKSSVGYSGKATVEYPNGDVFEGRFVEGVRQGFGKYTYANKDVYDGNWKNNLKHGIGKLTINVVVNEETGKKSGGGEYYGYFENGCKHGEGLYTYPNKDIYSGFWKFGKKHGQGTYVLNDTGVKLIGQWNEGQLLSGKWLMPNGTYYEGNFKFNKPDGTGKWVFKNGNIVSGDYKQSVIPAADPTDPSKIMDIKLEWLTNFNAQ